MTFSPYQNSPYLFSGLRRLLSRLIDPFRHFYIIFAWYWNCSRSEYSRETTCWTLSNNKQNDQSMFHDTGSASVPRRRIRDTLSMHGGRLLNKTSDCGQHWVSYACLVTRFLDIKDPFCKVRKSFKVRLTVSSTKRIGIILNTQLTIFCKWESKVVAISSLTPR